MILRPGMLVFLGAALMASGNPALPRRHVVEIRGMAFVPEVLRVARGDTIVWVNRDIVPHTATAAPAWDTGTLRQQERGVIVPNRAGRVRYRCTLHPSMTATLIIR